MLIDVYMYMYIARTISHVYYQGGANRQWGEPSLMVSIIAAKLMNCDAHTVVSHKYAPSPALLVKIPT